MRYTIYSTWTPTVSSTSTLGAVYRTWYAGVRLTAAEIVGALNATFSDSVLFALDNTTGKVSLAWVEGETNDLELGNDPTLRTFLGFDSATVPVGTTTAPNPCLGWWNGDIATPWGGRTTRKTQDTASQWGRNRAAEPTVETTGSMRLWVHQRRYSTTFAADLTGIYALTDLWVRAPIEIIDQYGNSTTHTINDDWECAPELLDSETVVLTVETTKWL